MTIHSGKPASLIFMQLKPPAPFRNRLLSAAACLLVSSSAARAAEPPLSDLLRDGLYAEEVTRDPVAAAKQYEQVLSRYAEQRDFAASALFRLAEVRRKQDRKDDAIQLYQRLLSEFPAAANETKLARENLAALGGKPVEAKGEVIDDETKELTRLEGLAKSAPDVLVDPQTLANAVGKGWTKVTKFLLGAGSRPYEGSALHNAVTGGNLDLVKLLTDSKEPIPEKIATEAISGAIKSKRYTLFDYLLKKGISPGKVDSEYGRIPLIAYALLNDSIPAAEILLKNGADLNEMQDFVPGQDFSSAGTPLHLTIGNGKFDAARWLLEKGAKPGLPNADYGLTPLHYLAKFDDAGTLELMGKLLDAGAAPNFVSADRDAKGDPFKVISFNATPLETAIASHSMSLEKTKLLLKHGANPNRKDSRVSEMLAIAIKKKDPNAKELVQLLGEAGFRMDSPELRDTALSQNLEIVRLLFKYGANPNLIGNDSLLKMAARDGNPELLKILLDAGADLNFQDIGKSIIWDAAGANDEQAVECLKLLAAAGAKPPAGNWPEGLSFANPKARRFVIDRFFLPNFVGGPNITVAADAVGGNSPMKLATRQEGVAAPDLAALLWANQSAFQMIEPTAETGNYSLSILRKNAEGKIEDLKFDLYGSAPFPQLQWGDLVQFRLDNLGHNYSYRDGFPSKMAWALRKRISFPVTAEIEGKTREIMVRGDRVIFDPTKNEVPLCDAQKLVEWLWQPPGYVLGFPATILATRKGWPEVRLAYGSKEARKFQLQAGDQVKLELPDETRDALAKLRRSTVSLQVPGLPFRRDFGVNSDNLLLPISVPTLIQAIVETQVPGPEAWTYWKNWADRKVLDPADLLYAPDVFGNFTLLPFPDLSHIRIRRLLEDGSEKVIGVNLAKAISEAPADLTADAARRTDVILQAGDVVEISLKKDAPAGPWKGFTPEEERFFTKALSGKVQLTDDEGNVTFSEIDYHAPRFIETEIGLVSVPPASGVPSARGWWITHSENGKVLRPGVPGDGNGMGLTPAFLRDGDEYRGGLGRQAVRQQPPIPQPQPVRPRRVPPTPQR